MEVSFEQAVQLITIIGVPCTILLVATWLFVRAGKWLGLNVIKPIADRHIQFLDETQSNGRQQIECMASIEESQKAQAKAMENQTKLLERMDARIRPV